MARNLITDVEGVLVGSADDTRLASGVTVVLFEQPAIASIAMNGGAPALRDTALLEPEMTIERVDGFVLSGGSAFGLDAAWLRASRGACPDCAGREPVRSSQRRG
jgi:D-aminopeptidase